MTLHFLFSLYKTFAMSFQPTMYIKKRIFSGCVIYQQRKLVYYIVIHNAAQSRAEEFVSFFLHLYLSDQ